MNKIIRRLCVLAVLIGTMAVLSSCHSIRERKYYSEKDNYVTATGVVSYLRYDTEPETWICVGLDDLNPDVFETTGFALVGKNAEIVTERGMKKKKVKLGDVVEFVSAPHCFGNGYSLPIVSITVNGEELLTFEEGYEGLLEYLK